MFGDRSNLDTIGTKGLFEASIVVATMLLFVINMFFSKSI